MIENTMIARLAELIVNAKLRNADGKPVTIGFELTRDGRKMPKLLRELRDEGYITDGTIPGWDGKPGSARYPLTDLAYNQVAATEPNLFEAYLRSERYIRWDRFRSEGIALPAMVSVESFSTSEKKWLYENRESLKFYVAVLQYKPDFVQVQIGTEDYYKAMDDKRFRYVSDALYVGSDSLQKQVDDHSRSETITRVVRENFGPGLAHLGILPAEDAKRVKESSNDHFGFNTSGLYFGKTSEKWADEVKGNIDAHVKELAEVTKRLQILLVIQGGVENYGGWDKFLADYRAACVETVDEALAKKAASAEAVPAETV